MNKNYIVYFKLQNNSFRVFHAENEKIETLIYLPDNKSKFYLSGKYEATDEDLTRYGRDILIASEELKTSKILYDFDYITPTKLDNGKMFYRTHTSNIERLFLMKGKKYITKHEPINLTEAKWFKKCNNGGLQYCIPGTYDCFGYDFSNYYASIMASDEFKIPIKPGEEKYIELLDKKIKFGFYHVRIGCLDEDFNKMFSYSPNNIYTSYSLKFALKYQETYDVNIELVLDEGNNCYIYENNVLTSGRKIFEMWYNTIIELKKEFPKNILTKMLSSSLWGHLSKKNTIHKTEEEADKEKLIIGMDERSNYIILDEIFKDDGSTVYKLLNAKNPYKYNLRLKPFITSFGRNKTGIMAHIDIKNVVRIHTDGIVYTTPQIFYDSSFIPEDKTTGRIEFKNINNYKKV